jgi:transcriptional antiterminator NusG
VAPAAVDAENDANADADGPARCCGRPGRDEDLDPADRPAPELSGQQGDWYVVHSYAGYENKVKTNLESRISSLNMEDYIYAIEVPDRGGHRDQGRQAPAGRPQEAPGYLFVRMDLTDESWSVVRNTPGVTGFVGQTSRPRRCPSTRSSR